MSDELKTCPFCGGEAKIYKDTSCYGLGDYREGVYIQCINCGNRTGLHTDCPVEKAKTNAIKAWNTRKPMERIFQILKKECIEIEDSINSLSIKKYIDKAAHRKAMQLRELSTFLHRLRIRLKEEEGRSWSE